MALNRGTSAILAAFTTLRTQFETGAGQYHRLCHLLSEAPDEQRSKLTGPFPLHEFNTYEQALGTSFPSTEITFRIKGANNENVRFGKVLGLRIHQFHAYYLSGSDKPLEILRHYSQGVAQFSRLAGRAGDLLLSLPASIINCYPPEWREYEQYFRPFATREIEPAGEVTRTGFRESTTAYDAILPPASSPADRWAGFLHWLAWRGEQGLAFQAKRQSWTGWASFPYLATRSEFDKFMSRIPMARNFTFDDSRVFYSTLDDIFLCSALAINVIAAKLADEPPMRPEPVPLPAIGAGQNANSAEPETTTEKTTYPVESLEYNCKRDKIFISYSHKDSAFLDDLLSHLKPLERAGRISSWSDKQIQAGSQWLNEIQKALASTKVAVLLVTKNFLASDFIHDHELAPLLKEAVAGGVEIRWVLVRACNWSKTPLKDYQAAFPTDKPLAEMKAERDSAWVTICEAIEAAAHL